MCVKVVEILTMCLSYKLWECVISQLDTKLRKLRLNFDDFTNYLKDDYDETDDDDDFDSTRKLLYLLPTKYPQARPQSSRYQ